jgi:protein-L-isoaspartate(D-aspartate) O-methyltransferase
MRAEQLQNNFGDLMEDFEKLRKRMVTTQLAARGIHDPAVLEAMGKVPREKFIPEDKERYAYEDAPLPIAQGQTISQPYIVALMSEALDLSPEAKALEIGTGSGYAAAVLSRIADQVFTVERHPELARYAKSRYQQLGYTNIQVHVGDGTRGWEEHAPYDGIVVTAGGPAIPQPLLEQLKVGGRLVMPVGVEFNAQQLLLVTRTSTEEYQQENLGSVRFVPLIGEAGWQQK